MSFENLLQLLKTGDFVDAGGINRPLRQIDQNARYLWDVLQAAALGSTVYARRQTVEAEVKVGMALWFNTTTQRFERGLAAVDVDPATGIFTTRASAQIWGVVATKINATLADILLFGLDTIDISEATADTPTVGTYYLSGTAAGFLTLQRPPVSVAVLRRTPDGRVFVMPQFVDFLDRHTHYRFNLTCEPAGDVTPPSIGGTHSISNADEALPGWLPADHSSFDGKAPTGAVFGYNLAAHPALQNAWPPLPLGQADVWWDKGTDPNVGATAIPLGRSGLCILDINGIWWMSNCYGDVPWPVGFVTGLSDSFSDSATPECPRHQHMLMSLCFSRVNFATDSTVVLSLRSGDARIKVRCYGDPTLAATAGHLELTLDLNLTVTDEQTGYLALKEFVPETSTFKRGPMVEGIYALSGNVTLTGDISQTREIAEVEQTVYQGLVGVTVSPEETRELPVQLIWLQGAEEQFFEDTTYLGFSAGETRAYRAKIEIPNDLSIPSPQMRLRFLLLGRAAGNLPQLTFSYRIVPRPADGLDTPEDLPLSAAEQSLVCDTVATLSSANQYVEATSEPFTVSAGDTVYFTLQREDDDAYAAEVGVLRQAGILETVA